MNLETGVHDAAKVVQLDLGQARGAEGVLGAALLVQPMDELGLLVGGEGAWFNLAAGHCLKPFTMKLEMQRAGIQEPSSLEQPPMAVTLPEYLLFASKSITNVR
jgi:hypothetical protein